jgi:putative lipoprotein
VKRCILLALLVPLCVFAGEERIPYACDNGSHIDISFSANADGRPLAQLHFADEAVTLPLVPSASGALYRNGDIRLHTKDDDALLEDGKGNRRHCTRGTTPPAGAQAAQPAAASSLIDITGRVTTLARIALPPDATLTIRVEDTGRPGKPLTLAEQSYALNGAQVPIPFAASVDRDLIGKKSRLIVVARIEAGRKLLFAGNKAYPVAPNEAPASFELVLKPANRPVR